MIPSYLLGYWLSKNYIEVFKKGAYLESLSEVKQGLATSDNNRFLRQWFEVPIYNIYFNATDCINAMYTGKTWFPYNKGGDLRKWYGNNDYVVNWKDNGKEIRNVVGANGRIASRAQNTQFYFMSSITWSKIGTKKTSFRYKPNGHVFDVSGTSIFVNENEYQMYLLALLNTSIIENILAVMSPSLNFEVGQIAKLPVIIDKVNEVTEIAKINVTEAKEEWDSFEESWDFKKHPLI